MVKNIIFDIGDVLVHFTPDKAMSEIGIDSKKIPELMACTVMSPYWCELDRGVLKDEEIIEKMIEIKPELEADILRFFEEAGNLLVKKTEYADELIDMCKKMGYKVFLLSNYPKKYFEMHIRNELDFAKRVDGKVVSAYEGVIKPDSKIYKILLERYGLIAKECIFVDDRAENVEAANRLGINGVLFENYENLVGIIKNNAPE